MAPPDFANARTRHQKARSAGLHPDYWYPVEWDTAVRTGQVVEIVFWKRSIALFRGEDGVLRAVDDRCAHRQLKLSAGQVKGCNLVCLYHGWEHDGDGKIAHIPHDTFGKQVPKSRITSYPVQVRYGLIWIFPGNPSLAGEKSVPDIPEMDARWPSVPVDATWHGHHSMIIDNVSDFTHAYLHEKYRPFSDPVLTRLESRDDKVFVAYRTKVGGDPKTELVLNPAIDRGSIELCYSYPYQWSDTGGKIKHWCFVLPIDERRTRVFFLFLFAPDAYRLPFTRIRMPLPLVRGMLRLAKRAYILPLLDQDRVAIEAEQEGHERYHDQPIPELNPAVQEFQRLTISKWEEALA
ncbi:3-chlorobenzoate-3,4-dioxygenase [Lentzea sp. NBRC 105346]|uniref:aromatic ring-hydroxylating oxygenase subunit alpha n=1 Tax=Lentzea sp. NBRC 105346 TaxID=3032205 RepID=UPI0024A43B5D|nr:aromatic ring-hydroxylating dioxygenase subunit alpha [Lentzea sp. NBRC 105346]GLZ32396.1 3-chlorobenzoate-3,4-dioxygenase [Lentzea sp. NBRC 105346]